MSHYGHIPSSDVSSSGNPESAFFLRAGQAIATPSPFQIVSASGLEVASISVDSSGNTFINSPEAVIIPGSLSVDGVPVAKSSKVAYVGLVGTDITVAAGQVSAQTISANFAVQAGHTYRVSVQCSIANADPSTLQTNFSALYCTTDPSLSVEQVSLGAIQNAQTTSGSDRTWTCVFVAVSNSTTCHIECFNSSATNDSILTLNTINVANAPSVLVEDLGLI